MEEKKTKLIMLIIIAILFVSFVSLSICFKMTKGKSRVIENKENNVIEEPKIEKEEDCDKNKLYFKSESIISKDYSKLINKLDYTIMTRYYCYNDTCANLEKQLLTIYKENNPDSKMTSGFADYSVKLSNGKLVETVEGKSKTIDGIKNVKSVIANYNVEDEVELFYLDTSNKLYYYNRTEKQSKLVYNKVKDFTVFEGNDYISSILPSEGSNTTIALHTLDNKFMISYYGFDKFINIKAFDYLLLDIDDNIQQIYVSNSKDYSYEKHNNKEIIIKKLFTDSNNLYILTDNDELLFSSLKSNYCKDKYDLYKQSKVKEFEYTDSNVKIIFENDEEEKIKYLNKLDL